MQPVVIVLGGTGFIGGALTSHLRHEGFKVLTQGRSIHADYVLDLNNFGEFLREIVNIRPDFVIDLLAQGVAPGFSPQLKSVHNEDQFRIQLFRSFATLAKPPKFLHVGSTLNEDSSQYSRNDSYTSRKAQALETVRRLATEYDFDCSLALLNTVYGPGQPRGRFVRDCIDSLTRREPFLLHNPISRRDFVFIEDVVKVLFEILKMKPSGVDEFVIRSGVLSSNLEVALMIAEILNVPKDLITYSKDSSHGSKIKVDQGSKLDPVWGNCHTDLVTGLSRTVRVKKV